MSVSSIIVYGFGGYDTVYYIPTLGFDIGAAVSTTPLIDIELNCSIFRTRTMNTSIVRTRTMSANIARTLSFTGSFS